MRIAARKFVIIPLMVGLTLTAVMAASGSEYCKWTDESGVVHYSEKCPDKVTSSIVATESERTESQIGAAEEHSKSLLSEPTQAIKPTSQSQSPESPVDAEVTAHAKPRDSIDQGRMSAEQLEAMCEKEREKRLAPEREQLIENCITNQRNSQEYCETYYSDYGAAQPIIGKDGETVGVRPALYTDLPVCVAAWEATMTGSQDQ